MAKQDTLVVTPTLGNRESIKKTIKSVKEIGGSRVKHVIVTAANKKRELEALFPDITILSEPDDCKGIYQAINFGFNLYAHNFKYLTYINDDDFWLENFAKLFEAIDQNKKNDVVYGETLIVDENNTPIKVVGTTKYYKSFKTLLQNNIPLFTQQSTLMKAKVFIDSGGFDESLKLVSDSYFWLKLIESGFVFQYVNAICSAYTFQDDRLSCDVILQKNEHLQILKEYKKSNGFVSFFEVLRFRILNFKNYLNRLKL